MYLYEIAVISSGVHVKSKTLCKKGSLKPIKQPTKIAGEQLKLQFMTFSWLFETEPLSIFFSTATLTKTGNFTLTKLQKSLFQAFGSVCAKNKMSDKMGEWVERGRNEVSFLLLYFFSLALFFMHVPLSQHLEHATPSLTTSKVSNCLKQGSCSKSQFNQSLKLT